MAISVTPLSGSPTDIQEWDHYVDLHPDATIYHYWAWRRIFGESFGYRSWMLAARDSATGEIAGILPLYLVPAPFARRLVSVPFRDRGGALWSTEAALDQLFLEVKRLMAEARASAVRVKTLNTYPSSILTAHGFREHLYWINSIVRLAGLTRESLWQKLTDKRRNVRRALAEGLVFEDVTQRDQVTVLWYDLHLATQRRLGLPPFPASFFHCMVRELAACGQLRIFAVRKERSFLAAAMVLLHQGTAIYAYGASTRLHQALRPNDFLFFNLMQWLIDRGYGALDMGSDAPAQEDLIRFKRNWLAEQRRIPLYWFGRNSGWLSDSSARQFAWFRRIFAAFPRPVLEIAGKFGTRYLG